jgi:hypothetical protein
LAEDGAHIVFGSLCAFTGFTPGINQRVGEVVDACAYVFAEDSMYLTFEKGPRYNI